MTKYHVNADGNVGVCRASVKPCPVSPLEEHFTDRAEALKHAERKLAAEFAPQAGSPSFQKAEELHTISEHIPEDLEEHRRISLEALNDLEPIQKLVLASYGGFAAGAVNSYMLGHEYLPYDKAPDWRTSDGPTDFNSIEELQDYVQELDRILERRGEQERILYRGIPIYKEIRKELEELIGQKFRPHESEPLRKALAEYFKPGKIIQYPTYLSTSHDPDIAAERCDNSSGTDESYYEPRPEMKGIQLEIKTSAGVDITGVARKHYAHEREVVLPRNMKFRVESVTIQPKSYRTISEGEEKDYDDIGAVVQLVEVRD